MPNVSIIYEAFDRLQWLPTEVTGHMMMSARNSLNLLLVDLENDGLLAWKQVSGTIPLVVNQAVYTLPTNLVTLLDLYYTTVNGGGSGSTWIG